MLNPQIPTSMMQNYNPSPIKKQKIDIQNPTPNIGGINSLPLLQMGQNANSNMINPNMINSMNSFNMVNGMNPLTSMYGNINPQLVNGRPSATKPIGKYNLFKLEVLSQIQYFQMLKKNLKIQLWHLIEHKV